MRSKAKKLKKVEEAFQSFAEEFAGGSKADWGNYVEIFVNPTAREMQELPKNVRYAIDGRAKKVKVYVWDGNLLHESASKVIKVPYPHEKVLWGIGKKEGNKVVSRGGIYPARNLLGRYGLLKENPKKNRDALKAIRAKAKEYLDPRWENKWVDLSDFREAVQDIASSKIEEAFETYAGKGEDTVIFKNPTASEMREFGQYLRFIIRNKNDKNTVYVFSDGLMHAKAADELGINYPHDPNILAGIAVRKGKEWVMMDSFNLRSMLRKSAHDYIKMLETNWANPYINVKDYMAKQARKKK